MTRGLGESKSKRKVIRSSIDTSSCGVNVAKEFNEASLNRALAAGRALVMACAACPGLGIGSGVMVAAGQPTRRGQIKGDSHNGWSAQPDIGSHGRADGPLLIDNNVS